MAGSARKRKCDLVVSFLPYTNAIAILAKILFARRLTVVVNVHSIKSRLLREISVYDRTLISFLVRMLYGKADLIVAVAQGVKKDLVESFGLPAKRIQVINNPLDLERVRSLAAEEVEKRVKYALETTGCIGLSGRPVHHLSQGEKRMVAIAGVLAMHPRLIIYDEPSANLDIRSRRRLIEMLQASEHATLVASHDLEMILEICDRVVLIDQGNIVAEGRPQDVFSNEELMEAHGQERPHSLIPHKLPHDQTHAKHAG